MAEVWAFLYGWMGGIVAVIMAVLYGRATMPQLMRSLKSVCAQVPFVGHLVEGMVAYKTATQGVSGTSTEYPYVRLDDATADQGFEGLKENPMLVKPITVTTTCMMTWYSPDGTIGPPIECMLSLENNMVTVYQLLHLTDSSTGIIAPGSPGHGSADSKSRNGHLQSKLFRTMTTFRAVEHRMGKVNVLNTTVMDVRQFNGSKKTVSATADPLKANPCQRGASSVSAGRTATVKGPSKEPPSSRWRGSFSSGGFASSDAEVTGNWEETLTESTTSAKASMVPPSVVGSGGAGAGVSEGTAATSATGSSVSDAVFTGRVLIWRTVDGRPLFDSFTPPLNQLFCSRTCHNAFVDGCSHSRSLSTSDSHRAGMGCTASNARSTESVGGHSYSSFHDGDDGDNFTVTDSEGGDAASWRRQQKASSARSYQQLRSVMKEMENWSCVVIKFERSRDCERWHTLLSGLQEAEAWHEYAKTLPNPDTINTLLSRFFFQNMRLGAFSDTILRLIRKQLSLLPVKKFPRDLGGNLVLDDFVIGTKIPWISDVSEPRVSANGEVGFDFNLFYKGGEGGFSLFFRLALTYCGIRVPHVVFSVKLLELEATVHVSIGPPPSKKFWIGGHKPPIIRLEVRQGCASGKGVLHRILKAVPDLSGIMTSLVKLYLFSDMVLPYMDDFPLPSVVKSPKGSVADLRVRAFDWQRAAKISGAPQRKRFASLAKSDKGNPKGKTAEGDIERETSSGHISVLTPVACSTCSTPTAVSLTSTGHTFKARVISERRDHVQQVILDEGSVGSRLCTGAYTNLSTSASGNSNGYTGSFTSSYNANTSIRVGSPLSPASQPGSLGSQATRGSAGLPPGRAAQHGGGAETRLPSPHPGTRSSSCNVSNSSIPMLHSDMGDDLLCDNSTRNSDSDRAMSNSSKTRSLTSAAMRNLKKLLKVKGKDMARESVSRSKKKR
ncbi:hypothetical protein, conserved [Leishmania tarentolae]|uniref:SMP-LTD domain-containing protein n=1 Tax=Leishmania tarentolae TaxID=5689 RepID=A0A640KAV1_LEITA|nr:hypothetical protein, conserved [Leishmania tarentolae]